MATSATIDELVIKIGVDSGKAAAGLRAIAQELRGTASTVSQTAKDLQATADSAKNMGKSSSEAAKDTEELGDSLESAGDSAQRAGSRFITMIKSVSSKLSGLLALVKRVAMMRAIRAGLRMLVQSFKEGLENLVKWDYAFGNNTSGAYQTMTELKSMAHQLKNSLGAMAMPIIQLVLPALRLLANALMGIFNLINQAVRAVQGYGTYMKAVYKEVSAVEKATGGAAKAAKELQRILFGFDELNILPSENGKSKYGGTGALDGLSPYEFEETGIGIGSIGDFFGTGLSGIWSPISALLELLSGESPFKSIGDFFSQAWESISTDFSNGWETFRESISPVTEWISGAWADIKKAFSDGWKGLKELPIIGEIAQWLEDLFSGRMFTKSYWKGIWEGFKRDVVNPVHRFVKALGETVSLVVEYITHPGQWSKANWAEITSEISSLWDDVFHHVETKSAELPETLGSDFNKVLSLSEGSARKLPFGWNNAFSLIGLQADTATSDVKSTFETQNKWFEEHPLNPRITTPTMNIKELQDKNNFTLDIKAAIDSKTFVKMTNNLLSDVQGQLYKNPLEVPSVVSTGNNPRNGAGKQWLNPGSIGKDDEFWFANGGVPSVGSLFFAGEAGAEVVANMSHGTGVMNVSQMQDAVANGNIEVVNAVYAMANMVANAINNKDFDVYMDSAIVGQSVSRYQYNQARRGVTQGAY